MILKKLSIIKILFLPPSLKTKNIKENLSAQQIMAVSQDTFSQDFLNRLQDIHHFESACDKSHFGGRAYESF